MSAVGHCCDNTAAEGFFGMLKRERVNRRHYRSIDEARCDVFDYIERFHNPGMQQRLDAEDQRFSALTQLSVKTGWNPALAAHGKSHTIPKCSVAGTACQACR